jgi:hypothetical protein
VFHPNIRYNIVFRSLIPGVLEKEMLCLFSEKMYLIIVVKRQKKKSWQSTVENQDTKIGFISHKDHKSIKKQHPQNRNAQVL